MPEKQKSTTGAQATEQQERGLLDQIVEPGELGKDPAARKGQELIKEFVSQGCRAR